MSQKRRILVNSNQNQRIFPIAEEISELFKKNQNLSIRMSTQQEEGWKGIWSFTYCQSSLKENLNIGPSYYGQNNLFIFFTVIKISLIF